MTLPFMMAYRKALRVLTTAQAGMRRLKDKADRRLQVAQARYEAKVERTASV